jgi:hypothetical protein
LGRYAGEVLRLRQDAGIAVNHAAILEQNLGTEKRNLISALVCSKNLEFRDSAAALQPER